MKVGEILFRETKGFDCGQVGWEKRKSEGEVYTAGEAPGMDLQQLRNLRQVQVLI